jgi:mycothiol synthase
MSTESDLRRVLALAKSQRPDPEGWSLAVDRNWLEASFFHDDFASLLQTQADGELGGCVFVCEPASDGSGAVTVSSMLRPGSEDLWPEQLAWVEDRAVATGATRVRAISENVTDAEVRRWTAAGYDLVFEEFAMQCSLTGDLTPAQWPAGTAILEWDDSTAVASFAVYEAAFRNRPGFPGLSQRQWIDGFSREPNFLPAASFCAVLDGKPIGFVISGTGWIGQVGVDPEHRRMGLATALVSEARARMREMGIGVAYLHVNPNNPAGLATWTHLGWRECGRRGRFERVLASDGADTI